MAIIVTRASKGSPISNDEADANFINLNNELATTIKAGTPWIASTLVFAGDILIASGVRHYRVVSDGVTGTNLPTHSVGSSANGTTVLLFVTPTPYTPRDILTKLKLVDGENSGLNADLLDGQDSIQIIETAVANSLALSIALG